MIEELRKEYEGLGLTDNQILIAKSNNISPEQVKQIREYLINVVQAFNELWEKIISVFTQVEDNEELPKLLEMSKRLEMQDQKTLKVKRNKKGKPLKAWEKNKFFN